MAINRTLGKITVSSKAARDLIKHITLNFDGIDSFASPSKKDELLHMLRGGLNDGGIYISKAKKGLSANIYIKAKQGADGETLCKDLANKIKCELSEYLHMTVVAVNVYIRGAAENES